LSHPPIGYVSVLRVALTAAATVAGGSLAWAGASDFGATSLLAGAPATTQPLDTRFRAQAPEQPGVEEETQQAPPTAEAPFGVLSGAWDSKNFLGEIGGLRTTLDAAGITLNITENAELFGSVTGGARQSFSGNGLTTMTLELDTKKAFGFDGGTFSVSGLHIWGGNLTETNLLALQTLTGIEADRSLRLWELWYDQKFGDKFDLKIGAQSIDQEFMTSVSAALFINSAMGWGALPAVNLPGGGPAYPLASLGVRGQAQITDALTILGGSTAAAPCRPARTAASSAIRAASASR
jgi:porin